MKQTITADINTTAGRKLLKVIIIDEFGNKHEDSFEVEVLTKISDGSKTDFDWDEAVIYFLLTDRFANGDPSNDDPNGEEYDTSHLETYHGWVFTY